MQLIIAGFHRSGTSLLTQLLHRAGLFVGDELLGAMPSNPYGHFEDVEVLRLHRGILERHGTEWQWDAPFPYFIGDDHWQAMSRLVRKRDLAHADWGFKDPRVCLFMGAWKYVLPDAKVVAVYRDPGECVRSLQARSAEDLEQGLGSADLHRRLFDEPDLGWRIWDAYNRSLISFVRDHPSDCLVVSHEQVVSGYPIVRRINESLGGRLEEIDASEVFDPTVTNRERPPRDIATDWVAERVQETWAALESLNDAQEVAA